ncbi:MAG: DoxX family protein [Bacteroidales bacterium]|nr:DoxX family protein [Bacteroidales bacterium]
MASESKIKNRTLLMLTNLCRLLLATVFIVSGFVKAVDPKGLLYKLQEYAAVFVPEVPIDDAWLLLLAVSLPAVEFLLGAMLFMGTCRRFSAIAVLAVMLLFTPWTLVLAIWNPVHDCGCFGDAVQLSNWATFFKNVILLMMAAFLWVKRSRIVRFISTRGSWMVTLFALLYIGSVQYNGLVHLPIMDFRPFAVGADLNEGIREIPAEFKLIFRYEKGGEILELDDEGAPDSTWNYLGTRSDMINAGVPPKIENFYFSGMERGDDISDKLLADTNYICLLVIPDVTVADESRADKMNDVYDYCVENKIEFYALTSSLDEDVETWRKHTGAEYPFYSADNLLLKTMIRSNPGLLVVKGGKVVAKWNVRDVPELYAVDDEDDSLVGYGDFYPWLKKMQGNNNINSLFHWMFMFFTPLLLIFFLDLILRRSGKDEKEKEVATVVEKQNETTE